MAPNFPKASHTPREKVCLLHYLWVLHTQPTLSCSSQSIPPLVLFNSLQLHCPLKFPDHAKDTANVNRTPFLLPPKFIFSEASLTPQLSSYWIAAGLLFHTSCSCSNENGPHRLMFEYLVPVWWNCFGRIRKYSLIGGLSLRAGFEVPKDSCQS